MFSSPQHEVYEDEMLEEEVKELAADVAPEETVFNSEDIQTPMAREVLRVQEYEHNV